VKAIVYEHHGGPEVLEFKDVSDPSPREGQVLVDVEAVGVNYRDVYEREGRSYAVEPPAVIGVEGAGTVADSGERVAWIGAQGSYAERVAAPRDRLVPVPDGVSVEVAAAALLQGMTAHFLASDSYPIEDGDWVLVHAAAGGVGLLLTQIAKLRGGQVIATTSNEGSRPSSSGWAASHVSAALRIRRCFSGPTIANGSPKRSLVFALTSQKTTRRPRRTTRSSS